MTLYVDDEKDNECVMCMAKDISTYQTLKNFLITRFGEDDEGLTFALSEKRLKGFIVWWKRDSSYESIQEFFNDLDILGISVVRIDKFFDTYSSMCEYIKENNL